MKRLVTGAAFAGLLSFGLVGWTSMHHMADPDPAPSFRPTWLDCAGYQGDKYITYSLMQPGDRQYYRICRHWLAVENSHTEDDR
jgi:hypothetical protein